MNRINMPITQTSSVNAKIATNHSDRSGNFAEIFNEVNSNATFDELRSRYSNNLNITFSIAPEALTKMTQNASYKNTILREIDSFLTGSFVQGHPTLSYEIQIDSNGKIAYAIEVPKREESDKKEKLPNIKTRIFSDWEDIHQLSEVPIDSVSEMVQIGNRLQYWTR